MTAASTRLQRATAPVGRSHVRNWSYAVLEREVRANLVYRDFTRVGAKKMPDAKTMGRWGVALGPAVIKEIHDRVVQIAQGRKVVQGRKMHDRRPDFEAKAKIG